MQIGGANMTTNSLVWVDGKHVFILAYQLGVREEDQTFLLPFGLPPNMLLVGSSSTIHLTTTGWGQNVDQLIGGFTPGWDIDYLAKN
jgi:hypothetical protein